MRSDGVSISLLSSASELANLGRVASFLRHFLVTLSQISAVHFSVRSPSSEHFLQIIPAALAVVNTVHNLTKDWSQAEVEVTMPRNTDVVWAVEKTQNILAQMQQCLQW